MWTKDNNLPALQRLQHRHWLLLLSRCGFSPHLLWMTGNLSNRVKGGKVVLFVCQLLLHLLYSVAPGFFTRSCISDLNTFPLACEWFLAFYLEIDWMLLIKADWAKTRSLWVVVKHFQDLIKADTIHLLFFLCIIVGLLSFIQLIQFLWSLSKSVWGSNRTGVCSNWLIVVATALIFYSKFYVKFIGDLYRLKGQNVKMSEWVSNFSADSQPG